MNYLTTNQMIGEQHPKLCSYWSQQNSFQVTAVEKHDEKLIDLPNNDGTNSCSYLSLGIIDHFI